MKPSFTRLSTSCLLRRFFFVVFALLVLSSVQTASADDKGATPQPETGATGPHQDSPPIQDNSFLIEEAYNQEFGIVQHINTFSRSWTTHEWLYTFTQEWPIPGQTHQLSYTFSYVDPGLRGVSLGVGDLAINYRYQLLGSGDTRVAIAPRLTLLVPSGDSRFGRGFGGTGLQTNIPVSWVVNKHLVTHWNIGGTLIPAAKNALGDSATTTGFNLGQSFVWLVHPRFNALLETTWSHSQSVVSPSRTQ